MLLIVLLCYHLKTVVRTGVLGIYYWIEVRMESEEEHMGRQMDIIAFCSSDQEVKR